MNDRGTGTCGTMPALWRAGHWSTVEERDVGSTVEERPFKGRVEIEINAGLPPLCVTKRRRPSKRYNIHLRPGPFVQTVGRAWKELMPTDIIMPQMGESIVEGTITKWLKKPGDKVQRDEPLFEISTDKVDAEIPAPASGVLQEIKVTEGTTVGVNTVVGTISVDGESAAKSAAPLKPAPTESSAGVPPAVAGASRPRTQAPEPQAPPPPPAVHEEEEEARSSPLVRKIAREHGVSLSQISGTGLGGRITKQDIMSFIESQRSSQPAPATPSAPLSQRPPHRRRAPPALPLPTPATSSP